MGNFEARVLRDEEKKPEPKMEHKWITTTGPVHAYDCPPCVKRAADEKLPYYLDLRYETYWSM